jgi:hypothetical protein
MKRRVKDRILSVNLRSRGRQGNGHADNLTISFQIVN